MVLQTQNLKIGYIKNGVSLSIQKQINLSLAKGKLVTLIGANGIGKSTLLRTLTGIQNPLQGEVLLNNKNLASYSALTLAQNLSVVLTEKLPPSNLSVFELVALGRQPYTNWVGKLTLEDIEKINWALELTEISHLKDKKHFELSDGQLQKALVARALAQDTPIIILDEPTTHLDLHHKVSLFKLLKKLAQETQKCILFSTHDIDLAIQLSDEMLVMKKDSLQQSEPCLLIENGTFDTLFEDEDISFDKEKGKFVFK
ncbi:ABC transporter ATP-binding protein [Flavobacterium sp.]|uniref:ABC transporter ATP-binding protein n=1 Tax=Flavobacterium sp. TaxID=239 RepID=UPI003D0C33DD